MTSGMIVLAEDDPKLRKLYVDYLEVNGFTVAAAKDGVDAIRLLRGIVPTVLVLDVMMPNMDGIETCKRARKILGTEVPIMFLTASDQMDRLHECVQAGADDYMMKTESLDHILERIKHWATASSRRDMMLRRSNARREVDSAVESHQDPSGTGAGLSSETDETVQEMTRFITQATSLAPDGFGGTVEQKLFLFGYVSGVVEHWTESKTPSKSKFFAYLRVVLTETGLLSPDEIGQLIASFDETSAGKLFKTARVRAQHDCIEIEEEGPEFTPKGFTKVPASAAA